MDITKLESGLRAGLNPADKNSRKSEQSEGKNFADTIKSFLKEANQLQENAAEEVEALIAGETTDVHDVMIAMQKASVSFEMVMEIRNKMLEAYQELMRTQV